MAKFKKRSEYKNQPQPVEAGALEPDELVVVPSAAEAPVVMPKENPSEKACGINGCTTWYDDPVIMARHRERCHGIPAPEKLNQPKARNPSPKLV